jgi:hypothetical protein
MKSHLDGGACLNLLMYCPIFDPERDDVVDGEELEDEEDENDDVTKEESLAWGFVRGC